jgi:hypothetical protein
VWGTINAVNSVTDIFIVKGVAVAGVKVLASVVLKSGAVKVVAVSAVTLIGRKSLQLSAQTASEELLRAEAAGLMARASEVQGALDEVARIKRTVTAVSTFEGVDVLASGTRDLELAQRALLEAGEVGAALEGAHAEMTALDFAVKASLTPKALVTYPWKICSTCRLMIKESGGVLTSEFTAFWPGAW